VVTPVASRGARSGHPGPRIEFLDGGIYAGELRYAFSDAQRAGAARLDIELPPTETVEEHEAYLAELTAARLAYAPRRPGSGRPATRRHAGHGSGIPGENMRP
jgi:hypothetical protein